MNILTVEQLKAMEPGKIFASGEVENSPEGVYMTDNNPGSKLRWVACRGKGFHDWAIYIGWADQSFENIHDYGDKVNGEENIKKLVPCDDESFELYRY